MNEEPQIMSKKKIFLILVLIKITIITIGGYIYSLIPTECIDKYFNTTNTTSIDDNGCINWRYSSFSDSIYFIMTTVTTIGYGNLIPKSDWGKIYTILFASIGIPLNIVFLAKLGELLKIGANFLLKPFKRIAGNYKLFFLFEIFVIVLLGTIVFLVLPAFVIMEIENWRYLDALYYTFVTLFTIGFGDFVAGSTSNMSKNWLIVYRLLLYLWMFLGMSYISLIITYLLDNFKNKAQNLRNELLTVIEEKIRVSIRNYFKRKKFSMHKIKNRTLSLPDINKHENNMIDNKTSKPPEIMVKLIGNIEKLEEETVKHLKFKHLSTHQGEINKAFNPDTNIDTFININNDYSNINCNSNVNEKKNSKQMINEVRNNVEDCLVINIGDCTENEMSEAIRRNVLKLSKNDETYITKF